MRRVVLLCVAAALTIVIPIAASSSRSPSTIYGINLSMYGPGAPDQFVDDPATRALFASLAVPFVRVPIRPGVPDQRLLAAMRSVSASGATPVIILHGPAVPGALAIDIHLLGLVKSVFGSRTVYLEFGNEEDDSGISAQAYTAAWNMIIPELRARSARSYRYGGPVAYDDDLPYIRYFVRHAVPRPNFLSWHEYVCGPQNTDRYCDTHIARWAAHFKATNALVRRTIHTTLPIMITEWNLDANSDPRYADRAFIGPWITAALRELMQLRSHGLIGAMYYTATSNQNDLINQNRSFTPAGLAWRRAALRAGNPVPAAVMPQAPHTAATGIGGPQRVTTSRQSSEQPRATRHKLRPTWSP